VEKQGPILSLLKLRAFEHVFLFDTPITSDINRNTIDAINALYPDCEIHSLDMILSDTNKGFRKQIRKVSFREDLYYRLDVGEINWPSLREMRSDIHKLVLHILDRLNSSRKRPRRLSAEALSRFLAHNWEGIFRDLENVIMRSVRLSLVDILDTSDLIVANPITYVDPLDVLLGPYEGFSLDEFIGSARK
jgi:transcriptional regulator of aromatic amino acid metabolism